MRRICAGGFNTFSNNVVQVCNALGVEVPRLDPTQSGMASEWAQAMSSMRRIWDDTPEGAQIIARMLDAIADLQARARPTRLGTGIPLNPISIVHVDVPLPIVA